MGTLKICQLVPRLPPAFDGIGDYAVNLMRHLKAAGIESVFVISEPTWVGDGEIEGARVVRLPRRSVSGVKDAMRAAGPFDVLLVHYAGYGYARRGAPLWLFRGIRQWCRRRQGATARKTVTIFHELWASGRPWQSAFYLHFLQCWIARSLQKLSAASVTSTIRMQRLLQRPGWPVSVIPIPSNIPEATVPGAGEPRRSPLRVLIFGQLGSRLGTVEAHRDLLLELLRRDALKTLVIAGSGSRAGRAPSRDVAEAMRFLPEHRIEVLQSSAADDIAREFCRADCCLSFYPASLACKATTIMAALANGCPSVLKEGTDAAPLRPNEHFLVCDGSMGGVERLLSQAESGVLDTVGHAAREWYESNAAWDIVARRFSQLLEVAAGFA